MSFRALIAAAAAAKEMHFRCPSAGVDVYPLLPEDDGEYDLQQEIGAHRMVFVTIGLGGKLGDVRVASPTEILRPDELTKKIQAAIDAALAELIA